MEAGFKAASEAVESWVGQLSQIHSRAEQGDWLMAYGFLYKLVSEMTPHAGTIDKARDALANVSDGIIKHHGLVGLQAYKSAHEATLEICNLACLGLLGPLNGIEDANEWKAVAQQLAAERSEGLVVDSEVMRARICRERAKLLCQSPSEPIEAGGKSKAKSGRPKKGSKPTTNSLLIDLFNDRPECKSWSGRKLAEAIGRCRSSVEGARIYKMADELRVQTKAELALRTAKRRQL